MRLRHRHIAYAIVATLFATAWPVVPAHAEAADDCTEYEAGEKSGDDLLVLLNKQPEHQLSREWAPDDLVAIPSALMMPDYQGRLRYGALLSLYRMWKAARRAGVRLVVRSAYRSFDIQCGTFSAKVKRHGRRKAARVSAEPGRSQHQLGTTVDLTSANLDYELTERMAKRKEGRWLRRNAHRFGFALAYPKGHEKLTGYEFEPWHYRYIGRRAAKRLKRKGRTLERYLRQCNDGKCSRERMPRAPNQNWIGGACQEDADCAAIGAFAFCLRPEEGYPFGQCTQPCKKTCPGPRGGQKRSDSFCIGTAIDDLCHAKCNFKLHPWGGCREGYMCVRRRRANAKRRARVCVPDESPRFHAVVSTSD